MEMVTLQEHHFIAKGKDRSCFYHPDDAGKCIKIVREGEHTRHGSERWVQREVHYYKRLQKQGYAFSGVARYFGAVQTNFGAGHVYELLRNADGSVASELEQLLQNEEISPADYESGLRVLFEDLCSNAVPLAELHMGNICVALQEDGTQVFKIVDGLGNSDAIKHCDYFPFLMRKKVIRKFKKGLSLAKEAGHPSIPCEWLER